MNVAIPSWDPALTYSQEQLINHQAGSLTINTPILPTGKYDPLREIIYIGQTIAMSDQGQKFPVNFPIAAKSTAEAIEQWPLACAAALEEMNSQATRSRILSGSAINGFNKRKY